MTKCLCQCLSHNGFLTAKGLTEAAQREVHLDGVDGMDLFHYVDSRVSVSATERNEAPMSIFSDEVLDEQEQRYFASSRGGV